MKVTRKRKPIKPNLPSLEEIGKIFRKRDGRVTKTKMVKCSKNPPGRPAKWQPGDQMRLSTRVRPRTHKTLHAEAKKYKMSVGELLDVWFSLYHEYQDRILKILEEKVEDRRLNK